MRVGGTERRFRRGRGRGNGEEAQRGGAGADAGWGASVSRTDKKTMNSTSTAPASRSGRSLTRIFIVCAPEKNVVKGFDFAFPVIGSVHMKVATFLPAGGMYLQCQPEGRGCSWKLQGRCVCATHRAGPDTVVGVAPIYSTTKCCAVGSEILSQSSTFLPVKGHMPSGLVNLTRDMRCEGGRVRARQGRAGRGYIFDGPGLYSTESPLQMAKYFSSVAVKATSGWYVVAAQRSSTQAPSLISLTPFFSVTIASPMKRNSFAGPCGIAPSRSDRGWGHLRAFWRVVAGRKSFAKACKNARPSADGPLELRGTGRGRN